MVAGIATTGFYLGLFGLGLKPPNSTSLNNLVLLLLQSLKNKNKISSLSFGYIAGALYSESIPSSVENIHNLNREE